MGVGVWVVCVHEGRCVCVFVCVCACLHVSCVIHV